MLALLARPSYWSSGNYAYDGAGKVKAIGSNYYVYDPVSRLLEGTSEWVNTSNGKKQNQTYDAYGNLTQMVTTVNGVVTATRSMPVSTATNRLTGASYDDGGNQLTWDGIYTYTYDAFHMMQTLKSGTKDWLYVYTADDERLWEYNVLTNGSDYTLRDLDGKPLRIVRQDGTTWTWKEDTIRRDGQPVAAVRPSGVAYYHLDHLGTPRWVSNATRGTIGTHAYYPFGQEATAPTQDTYERGSHMKVGDSAGNLVTEIPHSLRPGAVGTALNAAKQMIERAGL